MKSAIAAIAITLALVGALVWNHHREHTLSNEEGAAVMAILGENPPPHYSFISGEDTQFYLATALLAVRTKQDRLVVDELTRAFRLWQGDKQELEQSCQLFKQIRKDAGLKPYTSDPCQEI